MPTPTYIPMATVTLGSSASSVTFSSIPATFRDLVVIVNGKSSANLSTGLRFNSDSGSNYTFVRMFSGPTSTAGTTTFGLLTTGDATADTVAIAQIMDYSATDKHKTFLVRSNIPANTVAAHAVRWANTAAITTVAVETIGTTWQIGTTFSLYGIAS